MSLIRFSGSESPLVTSDFISDDQVAGYAAIFNKFMFSCKKKWLSDSKFDVSNRLLDSKNVVDDKYI